MRDSEDQIRFQFNHVVDTIANTKLANLVGLNEGGIGLQTGFLDGREVLVLIHYDGPVNENGEPLVEDGHTGYEVQILGLLIDSDMARDLKVEERPDGPTAAPYSRPNGPVMS